MVGWQMNPGCRSMESRRCDRIIWVQRFWFGLKECYWSHFFSLTSQEDIKENGFLEPRQPDNVCLRAAALHCPSIWTGHLRRLGGSGGGWGGGRVMQPPGPLSLIVINGSGSIHFSPLVHSAFSHQWMAFRRFSSRPPRAPTLRIP